MKVTKAKLTKKGRKILEANTRKDKDGFICLKGYYKKVVAEKDLAW